MTWMPTSNILTIVLLATDVASVYIGATFFSERVRRWSYRKRWGSLPAAKSHFDSSPRAALGGFDDLSGAGARPQQGGLLRNPFEPRPRKTPGSRTTPRALANQSRRPTFRRSTILQQRIARRERIAADCAPGSPQEHAEAWSGILQPAGGLRSPYFHPVLDLGHV
jgi:hypothetical protein